MQEWAQEWGAGYHLDQMTTTTPPPSCSSSLKSAEVGQERGVHLCSRSRLGQFLKGSWCFWMKREGGPHASGLLCAGEPGHHLHQTTTTPRAYSSSLQCAEDGQKEEGVQEWAQEWGAGYHNQSCSYCCCRSRWHHFWVSRGEVRCSTKGCTLDTRTHLFRGQRMQNTWHYRQQRVIMRLRILLVNVNAGQGRLAKQGYMFEPMYDNANAHLVQGTNCPDPVVAWLRC